MSTAAQLLVGGERQTGDSIRSQNGKTKGEVSETVPKTRVSFFHVFSTCASNVIAIYMYAVHAVRVINVLL